MATLIVGASGFVGSALTDALLAAGDVVRAASRHRPAFMPREVDWVKCDVERPETLSDALEGITCAYYLVHSMGGRGGDFRATERRCAEHFARAADDAGCERIVYLGGVAPRGRPSNHLASRLEVGEILRAGRVLTVELRAAMIIGNGSASWQIMRDLATRLPVMVLPRWLGSKCCPIALADAITALLDARTLPIVASAWFDIPGPEVLTAREMLEIVGAVRDQRRIPAVRVPVLTPKLSALWLRFVTRTNFQLARELVLGLDQDLLPANDDYWRLTGHPPQVTFEEAARAALASEPSVSLTARVVERLVELVGPRLESA